MALFAVGVLAAAAPPASAQVVRVRLVDAETRRPLAGVLVGALNIAGAVGPSVLTSGDGVAAVRVTGVEPQRLLIRRIGFAPVTTDPVATPSDVGQPVEIIVPASRITLSTIHVTGSAACSNQTDSPSAGAQAAWNEVRTALEASALTRDQRLVTTAGLGFQRFLRIDGRVDYADTTLRGRSGERPFVAPAPAALERNGYFKRRENGSEEFYAPDEAVLLSPGFTRQHCITGFPDVRHDSAGTQIALAFVPRDRDTRAEIKGLIWLDSATSELRRLDFEYVRIAALPAPADSLGGSVEFQHLTSGAWIVSRWTLRMPRWRYVDRGRIVALNGYLEVGGSASVVRDLATPGPKVPRTIVGTVFDSLAQRPLVGAHVHIADIGRDATTDSAGAFRFDSVSVGEHTVWADHPVLDTLGLFSLGARVDVTPAAVSTVPLAVPAFATLWRRACGSVPVADAGHGFVFGSVHADTAGTPRPSSIVDVAWHPDDTPGAPESVVTTSTDSTGSYVLCGVSSVHPVAISAHDGAIATPRTSLRLGAARVARRDITLSAASTVAEAVVDTSSGAAGGRAHTLRVVSPDGKPVLYANVSVAGGAVRITNEKGELALGAARIHTATTSVKRIGFTPWFGTIDFPDTASVVTITLTHVAQYLGEVRVTGQKNPSSPFVQGFYDRWMMRQKGVLSAVFIGPEELEFRHPGKISSVLFGLNGVQIKCTAEHLCVAHSTHSGSLTPDQPCPMAILIDGIQQYGYPVLIDDLLDANDVMAVEVYARAANMPITLQANDTKCGVIAFWTGSRH